MNKLFRSNLTKRLVKYSLVAVGLLAIIILYLRIITAGDTWIKNEKGQWVKHSDSLATQPLEKKLQLSFNNSFTLGFAGEIILARDVATKINKINDYKYPFYKVAPVIAQTDLFFATLEAPLSGKNIPCGTGCMVFVGDDKAIEGLTYAGIGAVSLAANHIMDGGPEGLQDTIDLLDQNKISYTGAGQTSDMAKVPIVKEIKGSKIGILGYNQIPPLTNTAAPENITNEINELKNQVDLIVVAFHWGTEYVSKPNTNQVALAHQAVDAGADLIIGDHPHWVGAIEFYKEKPIFYSVGNFVFDQMWSTETRQGIIVLAQYENNRLSKISLLPTQIEESCQPRILNFEEGKVVLQKIFSVSDKNSLKKLEEYN